MSFDTVTIQSNNATLGVNPQGGYVTSWKVQNPKTHTEEDILYQGKTIKRGGIPILFPQFSNAKGMRSHGFGRDSLWTVANVSGNHLQMILLSDTLSVDAKKEYPFHFRATIDLTIADTGSFVYALKVENLDEKPLPIAPGLHPYWAVSHSDKAKIEIDGIPDFHADEIDWEKNPPDIGYQYTGKCFVKFPTHSVSIQDLSNPPVITHLVIWTQKPDQDDFHFLCVEPVCGYKGAYDTNPILITPAATWHMQMQFVVKFF